MLINVGEKYLHCARCFESAETLCPFHDDSRVRLIEYLVEAESFEDAGRNAVEIDVIDRDLPLVLIDQRERGAGNFAGIVDRKPFDKTFREVCLPGTEL